MRGVEDSIDGAKVLDQNCSNADRRFRSQLLTPTEATHLDDLLCDE